MVPSTLTQSGSRKFWCAASLTGLGAGVGAALLTRLLEAVQRLTWHGTGTDLLASAELASPSRHVLALLGAGLLTE